MHRITRTVIQGPFQCWLHKRESFYPLHVCLWVAASHLDAVANAFLMLDIPFIKALFKFPPCIKTCLYVVCVRSIKGPYKSCLTFLGLQKVGYSKTILYYKNHLNFCNVLKSGTLMKEQWKSAFFLKIESENESKLLFFPRSGSGTAL